MNICGLILAAGGSSRLGRPKQLVQAQGKSLLEQAISNALETSLQQVYVVLGAQFEQMEASVRHLPVGIIRNRQWEKGIGSSISAGVDSILREGKYDAVLIMLCDQLHINTAHLQALIDAYLHKKVSIVATAYGKQMGVPVLFDQKLFSQLEKLTGDMGAKKLLQQHIDNLHSIQFEQAIVDIDTPEDLARNGLA
jgi:molybdenum cofactor cytidylyltransferase